MHYLSTSSIHCKRLLCASLCGTKDHFCHDLSRNFHYKAIILRNMYEKDSCSMQAASLSLQSYQSSPHVTEQVGSCTTYSSRCHNDERYYRRNRDEIVF